MSDRLLIGSSAATVVDDAKGVETVDASSVAPVLKLLVKGFRAIELQLLEGAVKVSQRRTPRLELLQDAQAHSADVVLIDAQDAQAIAWARGEPWLQQKAVIWVDGQSAVAGHTSVRRPMQWTILPMLLARALEQTSKQLLQRAEPDQRPLSVASPSTRQAKAVLVVDDSLAARTYLRSLLELRGIHVDDVACAEAAVDRDLAPYSCVLMDVQMPGIDGYEACRRIKGRVRGLSGPAVVMLTSRSSPFDRIRGKMAGCDAYLTKPVDPEQLRVVLARYVSRT